MKLATIEIPLATRNDANGQRGHWAVTQKKRDNEKRKVMAYLLKFRWPKLLRVTLTRLGGKEMDHGGLVNALKATQDGVAARLKVDDAPSGVVEWCFAQEPGAREEGEAVRVEVEIIGPAAMNKTEAA